MHALIYLKDCVAMETGLQHDALQILASLFICLISAVAFKKPMSEGFPWLAVFIVAALNEALSGFADGVFDTSELWQSLRDMTITMIIPTILLVIGRYAPRVMLAERRIAHIYVPTIVRATMRPIVDAEYEEIS